MLPDYHVKSLRINFDSSSKHFRYDIEKQSCSLDLQEDFFLRHTDESVDRNAKSMGSIKSERS